MILFVTLIIQAGVFALDVVMAFKIQERPVMMEILNQTMDVLYVSFKQTDLPVRLLFRHNVQSYREIFVGMDYGIL